MNIERKGTGQFSFLPNLTRHSFWYYALSKISNKSVFPDCSLTHCIFILFSLSVSVQVIQWFQDGTSQRGNILQLKRLSDLMFQMQKQSPEVKGLPQSLLPISCWSWDPRPLVSNPVVFSFSRGPTSGMSDWQQYANIFKIGTCIC